MLTTTYTPGENQVLIASRDRFQAGDLQAPAIYSSVPLNALHVVLPGAGLDLLGFRMPSGKEFDAQFRRPTSDWVIEAATRLRDKPSVLIGDFNIAPGDPVSRCGDFFDRMSEIGWFHAQPVSGCSFRHSSGSERQIDHCFVSPKISARRVEYRWDFQTAGPTPRIGNPGIPDHAMVIADVEYRVGDERAREPGGEMSTRGKDGKLSNGEIMLEMLGDEPDVSHTSLALAKRLGMSEDVLRRLGKKDAAVSSEDKGKGPTGRGER